MRYSRGWPGTERGQAKRRGAKWSEVERSGADRSAPRGWHRSRRGGGRVVITVRSLFNACTAMALPVPPWHMAFGSKMSGNRLSVLFQCYSSVGGVVATNLERTGFGMSIGIGDSKPAPLFEANKKKNRRGRPPRAHGHWPGMGMGGW